MKQWLWDNVDSLRHIFQRLARTPVASTFTILVIGIALSLPAALYVFLENVKAISANVQNEPEISLFLSRDAMTGDITKLQTSLKKHPAVSELRVIRKDQALQSLKKRHDIGDLVSGLKQNPLPDVIVMRLQNNNPYQLQKLRAEWATLPLVDLAQADSAWAEKLSAFLAFGRISVWILAILLGIALVAVVGNTIRLQIFTQKDEIEVSKLIGATDGFIRRPFLYYGALQGLLGGLAAWLIVVIGATLLKKQALTLLDLYGIPMAVRSLPPVEAIYLLLIAMLLGWLGAYIAVNRHLRVFS